jgi:hypothetical protein
VYMDIFWWALVIYLVIGVLKALNHLGSGRQGAAGPLVTFIAMTLLWPVL